MGLLLLHRLLGFLLLFFVLIVVVHDELYASEEGGRVDSGKALAHHASEEVESLHALTDMLRLRLLGVLIPVV